MVENGAFHKFSYGLFVLTAKDQNNHNGCIVNTAIQITDNPKCITIAVNKQNYTCGMILNSGKFNVSILSEKTPFSIFQRFGFASGRDTDKFVGFDIINESQNGLYYLTEYANAYLSCEVIYSRDCGSHALFVCSVSEAKVLSDEKSMTYAYYFENVKPKPQPKTSSGKVWVCLVCGYTYDEQKEGVAFENLPNDWACAWCKHPKSDFNEQK